MCLACCHTILIDEETNEYQASSPDELALINFAKYSGYEFKGIDMQNIITIKKGLEGCKYKVKVEYILEFNSDRKRMSIVIRDLQTN